MRLVIVNEAKHQFIDIRLYFKLTTTTIINENEKITMILDTAVRFIYHRVRTPCSSAWKRKTETIPAEQQNFNA
jgi:hypothetical protein